LVWRIEGGWPRDRGPIACKVGASDLAPSASSKSVFAHFAKSTRRHAVASGDRVAWRTPRGGKAVHLDRFRSGRVGDALLSDPKRSYIMSLVFDVARKKRTAQRLMKIASDPRLSKASNRTLLGSFKMQICIMTPAA
jgi:hypothetical protein